MSNDPLLQSFQLRHLKLRNRIFISAHEPAYAEDGMPKARYRAYHVERAKAGVALTMTAGSATVSRDSPPVFNNVLLYKDEVVPWLRDLADACHEYGAAVMIQLTHLGRRSRWDIGDWLPTISSSTRREPAHRAFPKLIEEWDIHRTINDFADAAERVRDAGLDGIELEAYGHLIDQFWSPKTNELINSPFNGSLESRTRLAVDVLSAIRKRVGSSFIVGVRSVVDDTVEGSISKADGLHILQILKEAELIDFVNVIRGHIETDPALTGVIPVQGMPSAPHLDFAGEVREYIGLPTLHAAKIADLATARHAISAGKVDLIGMTRAHIADPHIVKKLRDGREDDIRPCVGANYCLDRIYQGGVAHCIHNASTGREQSMPHSLRQSTLRRYVFVVGAGPAGLEAARVAAERGHRVTVWEAASAPGGQLRLATTNRHRRDMQAIIDWRVAQCHKNGVEFQYEALAEANDILTAQPDVIIIATGGTPPTDNLKSGNEHTCSAWDILSGHVKPKNNVLIFDEVGDHVGLQAAERIAEAGARVELLTPDRTIAPEVMNMTLVPYVRRLQRLDVIFTIAWRLNAVDRSGTTLFAKIVSDYGDQEKTQPVEQVVVNCGTKPNDELYFALKPYSVNYGEVDYDALIRGKRQAIQKNAAGRFQLFRVGDAVSSRNLHAAIYDSFRLVKDI